MTASIDFVQVQPIWNIGIPNYQQCSKYATLPLYVYMAEVHINVAIVIIVFVVLVL